MKSPREALANEAARIMATEAVRDFGIAKRRAAGRLGVDPRVTLPNNEEIQSALANYQSLFDQQGQQTRLEQLRAVARQAMTFLETWRPSAVGALASGIAPEHSRVELHVFADSVEEISLALSDARIDHELSARKYRTGRDQYREYPILRTLIDTLEVDITVFPYAERGQPPLCPASGKPMQRIKAKQFFRQTG